MIEQQMWVCEENIKRFQSRLAQEADETRKSMTRNLLAFEQLELQRLICEKATRKNFARAKK
ncbi:MULTISPECIES: hypothetical protein [unclassified Acidocella]|uniref:hypothetical protein n=1 Tax=unclassified Acidocella TaxID=2648610 RepID=UPI00028CD607|nr:MULTISPECIES: hypothetical protein [unclassified Acidocella]EKM98112.1 hypothetical protein MXAZACID_17124 [Acidocella sp. MX-AZ02]WBO59435.1 hypothetical protein GT370_00315 [Acidocella sp. MX-AZ03]